MPRQLNPDTVTKPASHYAQAVTHKAAAERIVISGQIGVTKDGAIVKELAAQMEQAWANLFAILAAAGYEKTDLVRIVIYMTAPADVPLYRTTRDRMLDGHACATTFVQVAGLAHPDLLFEVEGEAVKE
ncbi:MAG: RidA family protein [Hyphomicrobiaceae bacterium]